MITSCSANNSLFYTYFERSVGSTFAASRSIQVVHRASPMHPQKCPLLEPYLHPPEPYPRCPNQPLLGAGNRPVISSYFSAKTERLEPR